MNSHIDPTTMVVVYHMLTVISGVFIVYLGYRLFRFGVYEKDGEFRGRYRGASLVLRQAGPGTFFALFGSVVISVSIWKGLLVETNYGPLGSAPKPITNNAGLLGNVTNGNGQAPLFFEERWEEMKSHVRDADSEATVIGEDGHLHELTRPKTNSVVLQGKDSSTNSKP